MGLGLLWQIGRVYWGILRKIGLTLLVILVAGSLSIIIVLPLWILSTKHTSVYNLLIGACFTGGAIFFLGYRLYKSARRTGGLKVVFSDLFLPLIVKLILVILFLVLVYFVALVYAKSSLLLGILATVAYAGLLSFTVYLSVKRKS